MASKKTVLLLTIFLVVAALLRFYHLGGRPLHDDEPYHTVYMASQSLSFIFTTTYGSNVYPVILHFIMPWADVGFMARLPAAVFGFLSILGIYLVGTVLFGKKEGLLAAFALTLSSYGIYYSQQGRGYSGLMLFSLLSLFFLLKALKENKAVFWGAYVFFTVINNYNHLLAHAILPAQVLIICIFFVDEWLKKKRLKLKVINYKKYVHFGISIALILIITSLLYLPTLDHFTGKYLSRSTKSLLSFKTDFRFSDVVTETFKRQLEYYTSHPIFYAKLLLILLGIAMCLKSQKKELAVLFTYLTIPFLVFFYLNPPPRDYLPTDNKFIFMMPLLLLLLAKGLMLITRIKATTVKYVTFAFVLFTFFLSEGILLKDYSHQFWKIRSLERSREINSYLKQHVEKDDMILFANSRILDKLLYVSPVYYPDQTKKGFMIQEIGFFFGKRIVSEDLGLWLVLNKSRLSDKDITEIHNLSPDIKVDPLKHDFIIHFQGKDQTSIQKLKTASSLLPLLPITKEEKAVNRLILAKAFLSAYKYEEALRELENLDMLVLHENKNGVKILYDEIGDSLFEKATKLILDGNYKTAISMQEKAIEFNPQKYEYHLALAESYAKTGQQEEALHEYKKAITLNFKPIIEARIIRKIRGLRSLPNGYIIWPQENIWHIRWWSNKKGTFTGQIEVTLPIQHVKGFKLNDNDTYEVQEKSVIYKAITKNGKIEGLDIITKTRSELKYDLMIDEQKDIEDQIILINLMNM